MRIILAEYFRNDPQFPNKWGVDVIRVRFSSRHGVEYVFTATKTPRCLRAPYSYHPSSVSDKAEARLAHKIAANVMALMEL